MISNVVDANQVIAEITDQTIPALKTRYTFYKSIYKQTGMFRQQYLHYRREMIMDLLQKSKKTQAEIAVSIDETAKTIDNDVQWYYNSREKRHKINFTKSLKTV